jgi:NarL family two-component system response regulator LiaR
MEKYKIAILDDEPVWIDAIVSLLMRAPEIEVVGTAVSQNEAVEIARQMSPDIFLVDVNLGHAWQTGISATIAIMDASPSTEVIVLTAAESDQHVMDAVAAGAIDYMQKSNCELLLPTIIKHMKGEFSPATVLAKSYASLRRESITKSLTDQEYQILEQLEKNASRSQIQVTLNKSESTIKTQIRSLLHKMDVSKTTEAVSKIRHGGVHFPEESAKTSDNMDFPDAADK